MSKPIEKSKKKYVEYVQEKLKKYKVDSPGQVPSKFKKKFFMELDKGWESKKEKKQKKKGDSKELWIKDIQEKVKKKQKNEKPTQPIVKIENIKKAVKELLAYKPPKGLFKEPGTQIAKQLLSDAKSPGQALQRLNFYINRAGSNLSDADIKKLNAAKKIINRQIHSK